MASDKSEKAKETSQEQGQVPERDLVTETAKASEMDSAPKTESSPETQMISSPETEPAESSEENESSTETELGTAEPESTSDVNREAADTTAIEVESEAAADMAKPGSRILAGEAASDDVESEFSDERIQRILDIELPVNISFGSVKRPLSEVLKLGPGAVLELDRAADEPVTLRVNNKVFAKGEIVDVDGYYGVQITDIVSPAQRLQSLGGAK